MCFSWLLVLPAQDYKQSFDAINQVSNTEKVTFYGDWELRNGISGKAIQLGKKSAHLSIKPIEYSVEQTVVFWFRSLSNKGTFKLIELVDPDSSGNAILSLTVEKNQLFIKKKGETIDSLPIRTSLWYFCHLYQNNEHLEIKIDSDKASKFNWVNHDFSTKEILVIGNNDSENAFPFLIDELEILNYKLNLKQRTDRFTEQLASIDTAPIKQLRQFNGRANKIQDSVYVGSSSVILEIWDNDRVDNDVISVYFNETHEKDIALTKKRQKIELSLSEDTVNQVLFFVKNMGRLDSYNTAAVSLMGRNVEDKEYSLSFGMENNAVLLIRHDPSFRPPSGIPEKTKLPLDPIRTDRQEIQVSLSDYSIKDKDVIAFKFNDDSFSKLELGPAPFSFTYTLTPGRNSFIIQAVETKILKCTPKIEIQTMNGDELSPPIKLKIGESVSYEVPIIFEPPVSSNDTIEVDEDVLLFRMLDYRADDGDVVSVFFENELIVEEHPLGSPKEFSIRINPDRDNVVRFRSDSSGKYAGNSCRIEIYYTDSRKKITELTIQSYAREMPAILVIKKRDD